MRTAHRRGYRRTARTCITVSLLVALVCAAGRASEDNADEAAFRTWHSRKGTELRARLLTDSGGAVTLVTEDGGKAVISRADLSEDDRDYLQRARRKVFEERLGQRKPAPRTAKTSAARGVTADYLTDMERAVIDEMNLARTEPETYAKFLKRYRVQHRGGNVFEINGARYVTKEGLPAVDEAIEVLLETQPIGPLRPGQGLSKAAADHARDQGPKGLTGHDGSDGSTTDQRVSRHGKWTGSVGENISYGHGDARQIVMQLIIDDGVPGRGHRTNIFSRKFNMAGVSIGPHKVYGTCCVIDYAGGFIGR